MTDAPIQVTENGQLNITILPNDFIDGPMCSADGEYVKIYLMILRLAGSGLPCTPDIVADHLNLTQRDVLRAIAYWEKAGLLKPLVGKEPVQKEEAPLPPAEDRPIPEKKTLTPMEMKKNQEGSDLSRNIFMAETYLGHLFSHNELNTFCYINDQLNFSSELMEYLIEYCVDRGKTSLRYIERVAIEWYRKGITTVAQAKEESDKYVNHVFPVMKAFGLSGRGPAPAELEFIKHWSEMGLPEELILEACSRTLLAVHQPSFQYANSIIERWHKEGVQSMEDVDKLDLIHQQQKDRQKKTSDPSGQNGSRQTRQKNAFHNFDQRTYDYKELEERLLSRDRR